jgi:hypothetical protein
VTTRNRADGRLLTSSCGTVTRRPLPIGVPFTIASSRSGILPGDGNYPGTDNTGIMAMTMNGIPKHEGRPHQGPRPEAGRRARGNRR